MPDSTKLTTAEAADELNLTIATLEAWRHRGQGPPYVKLGRTVRYERDALDRWVASRTVAPLAAPFEGIPSDSDPTPARGMVRPS